jgi:hypothetical protein
MVLVVFSGASWTSGKLFVFIQVLCPFLNWVVFFAEM